MHTSQMDQYAVVIGRNVLFMKRPAKTKQKAYREPLLVSKKRYRNRADAEMAKAKWEGTMQ